MAVRTLYLATWGNPLEWQTVEYQCGGGEKRSGFASVVCAEADRYVVYVLDSVITASGGGQGRPPNRDAVEAARSAGLAVDEKDGRVTISPPQCEGWRRYVREYIGALARRAGVEASVVATAAVGRLGGRLYRGTPDLVLSELIHGLWREVEALGPPSGQLRIAVDVTHGVNFMPTVALWAARLIASLALAAGYEKAVVQAYNATPGEWHYVKVYSEEVTHIQFPRPPARPAPRALYYGAPLHYAHLCREEAEPPDPTREPQCNGAEVHYPTPHVKPLDLYEAILTKAACPQTPPTLRKLAQWHLVKALTPTARRVVEHELNNIANRAQAINKCTKLADLLPYAADDPQPCRDDNRNFVAHAGLLASHTTICPHGDDHQLIIDIEKTKPCLEK